MKLISVFAVYINFKTRKGWIDLSGSGSNKFSVISLKLSKNDWLVEIDTFTLECSALL